jgi:hypothetical protein
MRVHTCDAAVVLTNHSAAMCSPQCTDCIRDLDILYQQPPEDAESNIGVLNILSADTQAICVVSNDTRQVCAQQCPEQSHNTIDRAKHGKMQYQYDATLRTHECNSEIVELLPALISPITFEELFHALLDLPLLVCAMEKESTNTTFTTNYCICDDAVLTCGMWHSIA